MSLRFAYVLLVACTVMVGCAAKLPPQPPVYPVHGKVVLANGEPMFVGAVHLKPKDLNKAIPCEGELKEDGTFSVKTFTGTEGAVPGTYLVSIEGYDPARFGPLKAGKKPPVVPDKYTDPSTAEIIVEIKAGDNDLGTISLK